MDKEMEQQWDYRGPSQRGVQYEYSDRCIEMAAVLRSVYHLKYRQLEGFLGSVVRQLGWSVKVPNYTVINRRVKGLAIDILSGGYNEHLGLEIGYQTARHYLRLYFDTN
jgi:hypothetical protein